MRRSLVAAAVVCLALLAAGQEGKTAPAAIPTPAELDRAIEDFARQIPAGITADRYAAMAVAMPADFVEYDILNKQALLVVAALSKDPAELPLKRVYLEQDNATLELQLVGCRRRGMPADSSAGKLMGTQRVDAYYLIPLSAWRKPGTLLADFAAHRQEFILGKFPQPIKEEFIRNDAHPEPEPGREVVRSAVDGILARSVPATAATVSPTQDIRLSAEQARGMQEYAAAPSYPRAALAQRVQGTVVLHLLIGTDGTVQEIDVISGPPLLVPAAVEAVSRWRYRPYRVDGQPVEMDTQVSLVFTLARR